MSCSGAVFGGLMLVHGGFNTEAKVVLDDFNLFDFKTQTWLKVRMVRKQGRLEFSPSCLYSNDLTRKKDHLILNERRDHQISAVWDRSYYEREYSSHGTDAPERVMWNEERKDLGYKEGFYIFGGLDQRMVAQNDLWFVYPDYEYNRQLLSIVDLQFVTDPKELGMMITKIDDFKGKPPAPRSQFQMCNLKNGKGEQLLVIYGGRNDNIFE